VALTLAMERILRKELVEEWRCQYPANHVSFFKFGDCVIEVRTNTSILRDALRVYFRSFLTAECPPHILVTAHEARPPAVGLSFVLKEPDPGKDKIKEEYVNLDDGRIVRKRLTGMVFVFGGGDHVAIGPCAENVNQVVNFINSRFIEWRLNIGGVLCHAAGIMWSGKGLALAGFSGMGKSTLSLHLLSLGAVFVSNDRLIMEQGAKGLVIHGVAKQPRINPGTILGNPDLHGMIGEEERKRLQSMPKDELWGIEHKHDVPIDEYFGPGRFVLTAPMTGLVILNWNRSEEPLVVRQIRLRERPDLLQAFMKSTGLFYLPEDGRRIGDPSPVDYMRLLADTAILEMAGGAHFHKAARMCVRFLHGETSR